MFFLSTFIAFSFTILYTTISLLLQQLIRGGVKILQQPTRLLALCPTGLLTFWPLYRLLDLWQYYLRPLPFTLRIFSGLFTVYQVRQALLKRCGIAKLAWLPTSVVAAYQRGVALLNQRGGLLAWWLVHQCGGQSLAWWLVTSTVTNYQCGGQGGQKGRIQRGC